MHTWLVLLLCLSFALISAKTVRKGESFQTNRLSLCEVDGGNCIRNGAACAGWVDTWDYSCDKKKCCKPLPVTSHPEPLHPEDDNCGKITRLTTESPLTRIVGGVSSSEGQWPWQVSLYNTVGSHFCGGTLISPEWVLSAAHCFGAFSAADVSVVLGEYHTEIDSGNEIHLSVDEIIAHSDYQATEGHFNDIALLRLSMPVDVSGHYVRTACLPSAKDIFTSADACYASGWGSTANTGDSRQLRHVTVNVISNDNCSAIWGSGVITGTHICGGMGTSGTCRGDSGGPLVCLRDGNYMLAGTTSWGHYTCNSDGYPDVYTRTTSHLEWIYTHTNMYP